MLNRYFLVDRALNFSLVLAGRDKGQQGRMVIDR